MIIVGVGLAFFLSLLLLAKPKKSKADTILFAWMLVIGAHLLLFYLRSTDYGSFVPFLFGFDIPFPLLHGPFLFMYVASITGMEIKPRLLNSLHFLPFLMVFFFALPFFLQPFEAKVMVFQNKGAGHEQFSMINSVAIILSGVAYISASLYKLKKHRRNIGNIFSNTEKIKLNWLRYLTYGLAAVWCAVAFLGDFYIFASAVVFVFFIGFMGIRQAQIFSAEEEKIVAQPETVTPKAMQAEEPVKYGKSGLNDELLARIYRDLNVLMDEKKVYKESNISLSVLAKLIHTQPNYLSQTINEKTGGNFYNYINNLRIEEFKRLIMLSQNKNETILSVAYDCGFNSKSSFHKYFKQSTGQTPSQYINASKGPE